LNHLKGDPGLCAPGDPVTESELLDRIRGPPPSKAIGKSTTWNAGDEVVLPTVQFAASNNRQHKVNICLETKGPDVLSTVIPDDRNHEDVCTLEEEGPEEQERPMSISQQISNILHNYAVQIFNKAPNNKLYKISWCTLDSVQKAELTPDIFHDKSCLPDIFISYMLYVRLGDKQGAHVSRVSISDERGAKKAKTPFIQGWRGLLV
jgi:hypothetical protein